jgi:hypothetical protein
VINPIRIPGVSETLHPLDPTDDPAHDGFFVDIDRSFGAYHQFQEVFGRRSWQDGAVVVAVGDRGYGKTAVLNRCAWWLATHLPAPLQATIVDLRFLAMHGMSSPGRMREVGHHLLRQLAYARVLPSEAVRDRPDPDEVFPYLPSQLRSDRVVIVLMPPTDDAFGELAEYVRLVADRVVLLCETSFAQAFDLQRFRPAGEARPLVLRLGTLRPGDAEKFWEARRELHKGAEIVVPDAGALERFTSMRAMSVGEFQSLLLGAYDDVRRQHPPTERLTYDQIVTYFVRNSTFGGPQ